MRMAKHPITPLAAVAGGLLAGLVGTVCLDAVGYFRYRRSGGKKPPQEWEFAPVDSWASPVSAAMHWGYGSFAAALYGILAGSVRDPYPVYGLPFGAAVWGAGYVILPEAGIYKPIWEYDAKTLATDLGGHLAYGPGTGIAFWLFAKLW